MIMTVVINCSAYLISTYDLRCLLSSITNYYVIACVTWTGSVILLWCIWYRRPCLSRRNTKQAFSGRAAHCRWAKERDVGRLCFRLVGRRIVVIPVGIQHRAAGDQCYQQQGDDTDNKRHIVTGRLHGVSHHCLTTSGTPLPTRVTEAAALRLVRGYNVHARTAVETRVLTVPCTVGTDVMADHHRPHHHLT